MADLGGLVATGGTNTKEAAMLISAFGANAKYLLPPALTYVDSFGPLYLELGLIAQPATTDRARHLRTR
jgi:hypothetical protein